MRLQSQVSRIYNNVKYKKFWIIIPTKILKILGWKKGQELELEINEEKLVLKKKSL